MKSSADLSELEYIEAALQQRCSFLMVATIEPRKGHDEALDAMEVLWSKCIDVNLILVGRRGWMMDAFIARLHSHREFNLRLFWLEGISDEQLSEVYRRCTALLAASLGEGFGLPLVEAACQSLPIIARDIPVFREIAGSNAYYFDTVSGDELADSLEGWLCRYAEGNVPGSASIQSRSWRGVLGSFSISYPKETMVQGGGHQEYGAVISNLSTLYPTAQSA